MKNERIINAYNKIEVSEDAKMRMLENAMKKQKEKKPIFKRPAFKMATAAVMCFVIIGCLIVNPLVKDANEFSLKAYAMDTQDGPSAMRPMDDQGGMIASDVWLAYFELKEDTISFYIDVGWQIEGENIKKAEITIDDGYFYKKLERYEFEKIGNTVILEKEFIHQGDMLYVGYDRPVTYEEGEITYHGEDAQTGETWDYTSVETRPVYEVIDKIVLHAVVTYDDGATEEKDMIFDASEAGGAVYINLESVVHRD